MQSLEGAGKPADPGNVSACGAFDGGRALWVAAHVAMTMVVRASLPPVSLERGPFRPLVMVGAVGCQLMAGSHHGITFSMAT